MKLEVLLTIPSFVRPIHPKQSWQQFAITTKLSPWIMNISRTINCKSINSSIRAREKDAITAMNQISNSGTGRESRLIQGSKRRIKKGGRRRGREKKAAPEGRRKLFIHSTSFPTGHLALLYPPWPDNDP